MFAIAIRGSDSTYAELFARFVDEKVELVVRLTEAKNAYRNETSDFARAVADIDTAIDDACDLQFDLERKFEDLGVSRRSDDDDFGQAVEGWLKNQTRQAA